MSDQTQNTLPVEETNKRFRVTGIVGGIFWTGYEEDLGCYRWSWVAWLRAWLYVKLHPYREAGVESVLTYVKGGSEGALNADASLQNPTLLC